MAAELTQHSRHGSLRQLRVERWSGPRSTWASRAASVVAFGLDEIALVAVDVRLVGERNDVVGMVGAERALDAVRIGVGKLFGIGKQT